MGDRTYLVHILQSSQAILGYVSGLSKKEFLADLEKQDAVLRRFEVIGEATKHLTNMSRQKGRAVPWKQIAGMRDKLIHEYFAVDLVVVWGAIKHDLPMLVKTVEKMLENSSVKRLNDWNELDV